MTYQSSGTIVFVLANFVTQIPVPVALAIVLLVLCTPYLLIREALDRSKGATPAPRDVRKAGKGEEWNKLNKHHAPKLKGSLKSLAADPNARLLAPAIPYALCQGNTVDTLALGDNRAIEQMLARDWGITSRAGLLSQLYSLLKDGHREDYERLRSQCANPSWVSSTLARLNKTADSDTYAWEKRWRINRIVANDRGVSSVDFGAWDFLRVAMLTRAGAGLGWLSEDEAWDTLALVNRALELSYSSWDEVWDAFRTTRWLWAAEGKAQEAANDLHDRNRGTFLLGPKGLWTAIPWNAPYPAPRFLLLDAIAPMGGLRLLSPQKWERASAWERELDNQSRSRMPLSSGGKPAIQ